jgi:hypothetical protein
MDKIYSVLTEVSVSLRGSNTPFTLYPGDMVLCETVKVENPYEKGVFRTKFVIKSVKYKMSSVGFTDGPKQLHELKIRSDEEEVLYVPHRKQYLTIKNCERLEVIEDITRDEKLNQLLYEE